MELKKLYFSIVTVAFLSGVCIAANGGNGGDATDFGNGRNGGNASGYGNGGNGRNGGLKGGNRSTRGASRKRRAFQALEANRESLGTYLVR